MSQPMDNKEECWNNDNLKIWVLWENVEMRREFDLRVHKLVRAQVTVTLNLLICL